MRAVALAVLLAASGASAQTVVQIKPPPPPEPPMAETRLCAPGLSFAGWLVLLSRRTSADAAAANATQGGAYA